MSAANSAAVSLVTFGKSHAFQDREEVGKQVCPLTLQPFDLERDGVLLPGFGTALSPLICAVEMLIDQLKCVRSDIRRLDKHRSTPATEDFFPQNSQAPVKFRIRG